ncbi:MAG: hypothetical protein WCG14_07165 [Chlamydiia bacterium]
MCSYAKTIEKGHGRIEEREVWVSFDFGMARRIGSMGWAQVLNLCKIHSAEKG